MRKVQVFKYERNQSTNELKMIDDGAALFHQFGADYEEFESGPGNVTTAIIERSDGTVESIAVSRIKFLEPLERIHFKDEQASLIEALLHLSLFDKGSLKAEYHTLIAAADAVLKKVGAL